MTPPLWVLRLDALASAILAQLNRPKVPSQCMRLSEYRRYGWTGVCGQSLVVGGKVQGLRFEW